MKAEFTSESKTSKEFTYDLEKHSLNKVMLHHMDYLKIMDLVKENIWPARGPLTKADTSWSTDWRSDGSCTSWIINPQPLDSCGLTTWWFEQIGSSFLLHSWCHFSWMCHHNPDFPKIGKQDEQTCLSVLFQYGHSRTGKSMLIWKF